MNQTHVQLLLIIFFNTHKNHILIPSFTAILLQTNEGVFKTKDQTEAFV